MEQRIKVIRRGREQAVKLPAEFQFNTGNVYIRRDNKGNVVLSAKSESPKNWDTLLKLIGNLQASDMILSENEPDRQRADRDPFAEA